MSGQIVPFGKYKGEPVEVLAADRKYLDWLIAQSWFKERYGSLFTLVVNNFSEEPSCTPDHNAMTVMFLKDGFKRAVLETYFSKKENNAYWIKEEVKIHVSFEEKGVDVLLRPEKVSEKYIWEGSEKESENNDKEFIIEVKPTVSDDFPAVLRQMRTYINARPSSHYERYLHYNRDRAFILIVKEYTGVGASREDFISVFATAQITVIFLDEVKRQNLTIVPWIRED